MIAFVASRFFMVSFYSFISFLLRINYVSLFELWVQSGQLELIQIQVYNYNYTQQLYLLIIEA